MTLGELNELYYLRRELLRVEETRAALLDRACPGGRALTGMPRAVGCRDRIGALAAERADLAQQAERLRREISERESAVRAFVDAIPDWYVRTVFSLRYLRSMTWREVADTLGGGNTASGVRMTVFRYLNEPALRTGRREL